MRKISIAILALTLIVTGCTRGGSDAASSDQEASEAILRDLQRAHPVPKFQRSQLRQNLVELVTAQAETTQTTTFFFNMGVEQPVNSCPSIGFPIPATMQLTNPEQVQRWGASGGYSRHVVSQVEPTGVFTGDTTGTYVMCLDAQGSAYAVYWEGFTQTLTGPAEWNDNGVELVGPPSFSFTNESGPAQTGEFLEEDEPNAEEDE